MYIDQIDIENYGCIKKFNYKFRNNENNEPVPAVIVGKNGTGKTLLISNLIDAMVEVKRELYSNGIQEVNDTNYFKVGNQIYIHNKCNTSKVDIKGKVAEKEIQYIDIMSRNAENAIESHEISENDLYSIDSFKETGFSKKINVNGLKSKEYEKELLLYFPSDKYYNSRWYNTENYVKINYDSDSFVGKSNKNFIKIDVLNNINAWLTDVCMTASSFTINVKEGDKNFKEELYGKTITVNHSEKIQEQVKTIIETIKGNKCNISAVTRKDKRIRIYGNNFNCNDISQLSTGEMFMLGIATSILKEWDLENDDFELKDIKGCVIIDEVDIGMHIDYCFKVFPKIMKLFPKVQFIISTHSPFLLSGLKNEFGRNIDIINMPNGEILNDINSFEEMTRAYDVFSTETGKIIESNKKLTIENEKLKNIDNKIMIYTEGKTDIKYLKIALEKIDGYQEIKDRIDFFDIGTAKDTGDSELETIYKYLQKGKDDNIKICIFDRDNKKYIIESKFEVGKNKVYKFNIPIPSNRNQDDKISIEHYLKDEELKTTDSNGRRMFLANEFSKKRGIDIETHSLMCRYVINNSQKEGYHPLLILDGNDDKKVFNIDENDDKNYTLSKEEFVSNIENNVQGFNQFGFSEFAKIFDVIDEIRKDADALQ